MLIDNHMPLTATMQSFSVPAFLPLIAQSIWSLSTAVIPFWLSAGHAECMQPATANLQSMLAMQLFALLNGQYHASEAYINTGRSLLGCSGPRI